MILFLYGEDTYSSAQKLASIRKKYIDASLGDTNLYIQDVSSEKIDFKRFQEIVTVQPFLAKKRLIIFKNLLSKGSKSLKDKVAQYLGNIPKTSVVLFYEDGVPDKRSKIFKTLNKPKISQEFKKMKPYELESWIDKRLSKMKINPKDKTYLCKILANSGSNLWQISSNIDKLSLYLDSSEGKIDKDEIELLVGEKTEAGIFDFIDALAKKDMNNSYKRLHNLIDQGENAIYIFTMIIYQFRNLLIIKDVLGDRQGNSYTLSREVSSKAKINPYVAGKLMGVSKKYTMGDLKNIYKLLFEIDTKIKTGRIEPVLALDLLVERICDK